MLTHNLKMLCFAGMCTLDCATDHPPKKPPLMRFSGLVLRQQRCNVSAFLQGTFQDALAACPLTSFTLQPLLFRILRNAIDFLACENTSQCHVQEALKWPVLCKCQVRTSLARLQTFQHS